MTISVIKFGKFTTVENFDYTYDALKYIKSDSIKKENQNIFYMLESHTTFDTPICKMYYNGELVGFVEFLPLNDGFKEKEK